MTDLTDIRLLEEQLEGTEASFSTWLVAEGDKIELGQPIAELETDKVSMEVCASVKGIIHTLTALPGDKIKPDQSLGKISISTESKDEGSCNSSEQVISSNGKLSLVKKDFSESKDDLSGKHSVSPAVRRLLLENSLDINRIKGTGRGGRVNRNDVIKFMQSVSRIPPVVEPRINLNQRSPFEQELPTSRPLRGVEHPHTNMRKSIANHMVNSLLETSPHVTSVFEMDMGNIIEHRKWHKKEYAELGVKLTFTAYFLAAMAKAVIKVPQVNARYHQESLEIFDDVNVGVGTALGDDGLVVPVVHQVQSLNLFQIATALNIQTEKARTGKLSPVDMRNGTLTISNYGVSGSLFATPIIINQPQVAILGVGKLEKRVVVEKVNGVDAMVIRPKCYVSLSIDHRALDAHQTNLFLSEFVNIIESWGM